MTTVPDLSEGLCVRHPDPEMWDADASIAQSDALQRPAIWANARSAEAKAICRGCPVVAACLEVAMADEGRRSGFYRTGVRGGLDRYDRAALAGCTAGHDGRTQPTNLAYDPPKGRPLTHQGHGTAARYRRHRRAGEEACQACKDACAEEQRLNRAAREYAKQGRIAPLGTRRVS